MRRLLNDWARASNRFALPGEGLWIAGGSEGWLGVCGLNIDPYASDAETGRVRHLYVRPAWRCQGLASALLERVQCAAALHFSCLRLRTDSMAAARWYEARGFRATAADPLATHLRELR